MEAHHRSRRRDRRSSCIRQVRDFERTLDSIDPEAARELYEQYLAKARDIAAAVREKLADRPKRSIDDVADSLDKLGRLRESGILTDEEFARLKEKVLAGL